MVSQPYNLTYQWVEFPSDALVLSAEVLAYSTATLSLALYTLSVWVIFARSPPSMGPYRWYLLLNSTMATAMELLYAVVFPEPLLPYPIAIYGGALLWAPMS